MQTATAKTTKKNAGRRSSFQPSQKITLLTKENPKRKGSTAHKTFALYRKHKTVELFLKAGGTTADLRWDVAHKFIRVQ